MIDIY